MLYKVIKIKNGDMFVPYKIFKCDICGEIIEESWRYYKDNNYHLCENCAFKEGLWDEKHYLDSIGIGLDSFHAGINPLGEIEVWEGSPTPPWERTNRQQRNSPQYKNWRDKVFQRDDYTCQICGKKGGNLNAHHVKPFSGYRKLRYSVKNGITLCEKCHRSVHKKRGD